MSHAGRRLRVLQLTQFLGGGGLERVVATLATHLDRERFQPFVFCLRDGGDFVEDVEARGVPVHIADRDPGKRHLTLFRQIRRFLIEHRIDVVHSHNTEPFVQGALAAVGLPAVRLIHTDHARDFPDKWIWHLAEHVAAWRARWVVGVSDHTTDALEVYPRIPRDRLITVPNGIDGRAFAEASPETGTRRQAREALGLPAEAPVVGLAVARFTAQKGLDTLLAAFARVRQRLPHAVLAIAGDAEGRVALEEEARRAGFGDSVRFLGRRSDIPFVLSALDVYVLSSVWEGLPMAALEAMATGLPVVATRVGGLPTAVRHGQTGYLVPPRDPDRLAAALVSLLQDGALRNRFGAAGRDLYLRRFTAEAMTTTYERLYSAP